MTIYYQEEKGDHWVYDIMICEEFLESVPNSITTFINSQKKYIFNFTLSIIQCTHMYMSLTKKETRSEQLILHNAHTTLKDSYKKRVFQFRRVIAVVSVMSLITLAQKRPSFPQPFFHYSSNQATLSQPANM